jgi:hypothetical protein
VDLYARHNTALFNPLFKLAIKYLEPTRHDPILRRFANAHDCDSAGPFRPVESIGEQPATRMNNTRLPAWFVMFAASLATVRAETWPTIEQLAAKAVLIVHGRASKGSGRQYAIRRHRNVERQRCRGKRLLRIRRH